MNLNHKQNIPPSSRKGMYILHKHPSLGLTKQSQVTSQKMSCFSLVMFSSFLVSSRGMESLSKKKKKEKLFKEREVNSETSHKLRKIKIFK
jgi:hypothetical protein